MPVNTTHRDYDNHRWQWKRCRDVIAGRDAVLKATRSRQRYLTATYLSSEPMDLYLPRLSGQSEEEYAAYCERSAFFNASSRTLDAMTGLIFSKDPVYKLPPAIARHVDDITLTGATLREFSEQVVEQQMAVGRVGLMVDFPDGVPSGLTVAEVERLNVRPFLRHYLAENILNWRTSVIMGRRVLTLVVLKETVEEAKDEFATEDVTRYRVLTLDAEGFRVRLMNDKDEVLTDIRPRRAGASLRYIPFTILGAASCDPDVQKPPLLDLVDANLSHFRNSADYEHGLHFTGLPTPYVSGVQLMDGQELTMGSTRCLVFPDPAASAGFMEFTGEGLKALEGALERKERRMAVLGARMLSDEKKTAEAFGTIELKTAGERSALASVSRAASDGIKRALNWMAEWVGAQPTVEFSLNTDFGSARMEPQMLTALMGSYQTGAMPLPVLFDNLKKGELVRPDMEFAEYEAMIEAEEPALAASVPPAPPQEDAEA